MEFTPVAAFLCVNFINFLSLKGRRGLEASSATMSVKAG